MSFLVDFRSEGRCWDLPSDGKSQHALIWGRDRTCDRCVLTTQITPQITPQITLLLFWHTTHHLPNTQNQMELGFFANSADNRNWLYAFFGTFSACAHSHDPVKWLLMVSVMVSVVILSECPVYFPGKFWLLIWQIMFNSRQTRLLVSGMGSYHTGPAGVG